MKTEFTKEQFFTLMKAVYLGNWIANANRDGSRNNPHKKEYQNIEDLIFSFAKQFGLDEYVDDEEAGKRNFFPTRMFEEGTDVGELIDEYDDNVFWDELSDRLTDRDFVRAYSIDEISKMDHRTRFDIVCEITDKWADELEQHGIERLYIKE